MREHPLTARVAVNRVWQMLFGAGLVATAADFGAQGEYPSHPELLDWLAVDFVDNGWDVKRLIRQIVTSATYRQTSIVAELSETRMPSVGDTRLRDRDPDNRLLARGPRFRLPAEFIRDAALKISGLLVDRLGGPSVNPYTPGDLWREISHYGSTPATAQTFEQDHGEKLYRRSLYTYWKRTVPPPNMVAFDAPNREICIVARPRPRRRCKRSCCSTTCNSSKPRARSPSASSHNRATMPTASAGRSKNASRARRRTTSSPCSRTRSTANAPATPTTKPPPKNTSPTANRRATKKSPPPNTPPGRKSPRCC